MLISMLCHSLITFPAYVQFTGSGGILLTLGWVKIRCGFVIFCQRTLFFNRARIMTHGYDSALINKKSNDRIRDWADELLRQVGYLRTNTREKKRPIIFICHSLVYYLFSITIHSLTNLHKGGLVAREAMVRLHRHPSQFDGIKFELCGLMFLSTPHSGTTEADWNQILLNLSEMALGIRCHVIVAELKSFNLSSVDSEEDFAAISTKPPFHYFCEGDKTSVAGKYRQVSKGETTPRIPV